MNVDKLTSTSYPGGSFDVHKSENRKGGRPVSCDINIDLKLNIHDAALIRSALFQYTKQDSYEHFHQQEHQLFVISSDNWMNRLKQIFLRIISEDCSECIE